jgi:hypothetical protein
MATRQQATPPTWLHRSRLALFGSVIGGFRQNWIKLTQLASLLLAYAWPPIVKRRLRRLAELGHIRNVPTLPQVLIAARDQMMLAAAEETRIFYRSQGIPWTFHNIRRFISGPATMMDPVGLFSPRDAIIHHVFQTFHRHPVYDLVLLRAHEKGLEAFETQLTELERGTHPMGEALQSLIEDGGYHAKLRGDFEAFKADPYMPARPIPDNLLEDRLLMIGMDQFKDWRGFTDYAARLSVTMWDAIVAWAMIGWNETLGGWTGRPYRGASIALACCDPAIVARHPPRASL